MTIDWKKQLANYALELSEDVAAARLEHAGIVIGKDLGLRIPKARKKARFSRKLIKQLAGV